MTALALAVGLLALVVSATALALVVVRPRGYQAAAGPEHPVPAGSSAAHERPLPSSTFLLTQDQREGLAPEVQSRVFYEETLARISKRR